MLRAKYNDISLLTKYRFYNNEITLVCRVSTDRLIGVVYRCDQRRVTNGRVNPHPNHRAMV